MIRFIHIPKSAGTSTVDWLNRSGVSYAYGNKGGNKLHNTAQQFIKCKLPKFSVVRNPYTRLVSFYNFTKRDKFFVSFTEFVLNKLRHPTFFHDPWKLQIDYICDNFNNILIEQILYFESLEKDLQEYFNKTTTLNFLNKSTETMYENFYTKELKEIVYQHFKKDFELLGYSKQSI